MIHASRRPGACPRAAPCADPWGPPQHEEVHLNINLLPHAEEPPRAASRSMGHESCSTPFGITNPNPAWSGPSLSCFLSVLKIVHGNSDGSSIELIALSKSIFYSFSTGANFLGLKPSSFIFSWSFSTTCGNRRYLMMGFDISS